METAPRRWRDDRARLIQLSAEVLASSERKDWLLHMAQQVQSFEEMQGLIREFNRLQGPRGQHIESSPNAFTAGLRLCR